MSKTYKELEIELYSAEANYKRVIEKRRIKEKYKHKNSSKGKLLIPDFIKWLKNNFFGEVHHFYSNSRLGGRYDCFIVMVPPNIHRDIHFNGIGIQGFIDAEGEYNLLENSITLLQDWVLESERDEYQPLIDEMLSDLGNAIDIAKAFTV